MATPLACPQCGQPVATGAAECGSCGAKLPIPRPTPPTEEVLLEQLEDLSETVVQEEIDQELATLEKASEAETQVVEKTVGELGALREAIQVVEERLAEEEADLSDFVRRVEARVTAQAHAPVPPPTPSAAGTALLAGGGLLSAVGLFLLPGTVLVGVFALLAGVAAVAIGALVRFGPRRQ